MSATVDSMLQRQRQTAFQKLRPVCVELNSIILNFKAKRATVRDVFQALQALQQILSANDVRHHLYNKLADYARVPLFEVFNEAQRLSAPCLELAVQSLTLLVSHGWAADLNPDVGKQLLILMSVFSGSGPSKQKVPSSDELTSAAFRCIQTIIDTLGRSSTGMTAFGGQPTKNVIDSLVYLLADALSENPVGHVQIAACDALLQIYRNVADRVLLASLLPRTMSAVVAATKSSTKARRTQKVLTGNIHLIEVVLRTILADNVADVKSLQDSAEREALGESWLKASVPQVRTGLIQVCKLRNHDRLEVRQSLSTLCIMVMEECRKTLSESVSIMLETLLVLAGHGDDTLSSSALKHLILSQPELGDMLRETFYDWTQSLPRVMQSNEDESKKLMLARITSSLVIMDETLGEDYSIISSLNKSLLNSVTIAIETGQNKSMRVQESSNDPFRILSKPSSLSSSAYDAVILAHQSQKDSTQQLQKLIAILQKHHARGSITRNAINVVTSSGGNQQLAALWVSLKLLKQDSGNEFSFDDMLVDMSTEDREISRPYLVHDLYMATKDHLFIQYVGHETEQQDWRLTALSLEALTLQAQQLGQDYRNELYETLYPILALFNTKNAALQNHAVTTLNLLSSACGYTSAEEMLIENVDYLVNSIAWKLNTFDLSPEAPQVLHMIVRLVGARLIPHLDDLILNIFAALDNYHGYPQWVEMLFAVLQAMVDESGKQPDIVFNKKSMSSPSHRKTSYLASTFADILSDLQQRKRRKLDSLSIYPLTRESAPHRPWTKPQDDPSYIPPEPEPPTDISIASLLEEQEGIDNDDSILPPPKKSSDDNNEEEDAATSTKPKSKIHDLLLRIAEATVPHLSSPSARVRHLVLQLLSQVTPLLSQHENTFLPLVNAIWPSLVTRLFASTSLSSSATTSARTTISLTISPSVDHDNPEPHEVPEESVYNVIAAAETITELCKHAGNFMASRIEAIMPDLTKLYKDTLAKVDTSRKRHAESAAMSLSHKSEPSTTLPSQPHSAVKVIESQSPPSNSSQPLRTSSSQLLNALIDLATAILSHVTLNLDRSDELFSLLIPVATAHKSGSGYSGLQRQGASVLDAMQTYNAGWLSSILDDQDVSNRN